MRVPQTRDGELYPSIFERYQCSEKALVGALAESYVQCVSTRKMKKVTEKLQGQGFSSSEMSEFISTLDEELAQGRQRPLEKTMRYVLVDLNSTTKCNN